MRKEIGRWLVDVSKYMITGVFITSLLNNFSDVNGWIIALLSLGISLVLLFLGLRNLK
ncbi:MAG: hypothetical protein LBP64_03030 [Tannerella sp.]|jgi:hypothetical protein|nr:hypothetical protein [Tannerella sp.]